MKTMVRRASRLRRSSALLQDLAQLLHARDTALMASKWWRLADDVGQRGLARPGRAPQDDRERR